MLKLRKYQEELKARVYDAWASGHRNVMLVLPTGAGKTKLFCSITMDLALGSHKYPTALLVHRKELVQQISLTLAEEEISHNIIAPRSVILGIVAGHRRVYRKQFYDYNAPITVVSVDTLNARILKHEKWAKAIRFWVVDEAAHLLRSNKWGRAVEYFPNAIGLGVTATPKRLDKKGLGRHADGVFDVMVEGPGVRKLMDDKYLCKYKIAVPSSDYQSFLKKANDGADFSKEAMSEASQKSHIVGDVVENYKKFANGKQAILFADSIQTGQSMEKKFRVAGINAKLLTGLSDDKERLDSMLEYRDKKIQVLLNVDLFDEGLDIPNIECVIHARPTMSLSKACQMNGRGMRPSPDKNHLIIIDHVGNTIRHGLPCTKRKWTLDRIVKRQEKTNFIRNCWNVECNAPYDRALTKCPWCGYPAATGSGNAKVPPEQVDGDLELIDSDMLQSMELSTKLQDPLVVQRRVAMAAGPAAGISAMKNQLERIKTQKELVRSVARWAGVQRHNGYSDREIHKKYYLDFGETISQSLAKPRADMLLKIQELGDNG